MGEAGRTPAECYPDIQAHHAGSHQGKGWEEFTDAAIKRLAEERDHLVFILWGAYAQRKGASIDANRHLILKSPHPSPLSAHRGFFGNKHFSKANDYLSAHNMEPVRWYSVIIVILRFLQG
jgi:uracil-DNA glycosylase